jgi:hypothetical protein
MIHTSTGMGGYKPTSLPSSTSTEPTMVVAHPVPLPTPAPTLPPSPAATMKKLLPVAPGNGRRGLWIGAGAALVAVFLLRGILR